MKSIIAKNAKRIIHICFILSIILIISPIFSNIQARPFLVVYLWDFSNSDRSSRKWDDKSIKRFSDDFRKYLTEISMKNKCLTLTIRKELADLLSQVKMEKEIRRLEDIPDTNMQKLRKTGANAVIFGEIDDDVDGGEVNVKVALQAFNHCLIVEKQVQIEPRQRYDAKIRREKMKILSNQLCEFILNNIDAIKDQILEPAVQEKYNYKDKMLQPAVQEKYNYKDKMLQPAVQEKYNYKDKMLQPAVQEKYNYKVQMLEPAVQEKCNDIASEILSKTQSYERLLKKEKTETDKNPEINIKIISILEELLEGYNSIQQCPNQPEDIKKSSEHIIITYNNEIIKRKIGAKADQHYKNIEKLLKNKASLKKVEQLEGIIASLKELENLYNENSDLFPTTLIKIRSDIDKYNNELISFLKSK